MINKNIEANPKESLLDPGDVLSAGLSLFENDHNETNPSSALGVKNISLLNKKDYEEYKKTQKEGNDTISNIISRFFDRSRPDYFITLTFRDNRINNGTYIDNSNLLEMEKEGFIPLNSKEQENYQNYYYKNSLKIQQNVSITKLNTGIKDLFFNGMYVDKRKIIKDSDGITKWRDKLIDDFQTPVKNTKWQVIRTNSLRELCSHYFYVVEHGKKGNRRHIHLLVRLNKDIKKLKKMYEFQFKKVLTLWERNYGYYKAEKFKGKEHYNYLAKDQYILKDFYDRRYENYENEFGYFNSTFGNTDIRQTRLDI